MFKQIILGLISEGKLGYALREQETYTSLTWYWVTLLRYNP